MPILTKCLTFLLLFLFLSINSYSQWQQTNGPYGDTKVSCIAAFDSIIVSSAQCGTFISGNLGNSWTYLDYNSFDHAFVFQDTICLASNNLNKLYYDGINWVSVNNTPGTLPIINDYYVDDDTLFCASQYTGVNFSPDGTTFLAISNGLPIDTNYMPSFPYVYYTTSVFAIDGNTDYLFCGAKDGVYRADRSGSQWTNVFGSVTNDRVNAILCKDSIIFSATGNVIYRSGDNGSTWINVLTLSSTSTVKKFENIHDTLFALTAQEGIYFSTNNGFFWNTANSGLTSLNATGICQLSGIYFASNDNGVSRNFDNWSPANVNMICADIMDLIQIDSMIVATTLSDLFTTNDGGGNWINSTNQLPIEYTYNSVNVYNSLFFSATPLNTGGGACLNYLSHDHGQTWYTTANLTNYGDPYFIATNGTKLAAITDDVIFISSDTGFTWININPPVGMVCNNYSDVIFVGNDIYLSACGYGEVIKTTDNGQTWVMANSGLPLYEVYHLSECRGNLFAACNNGLYKSVDGGQNWHPVGPTLPSYNSASVNAIQDFAYDSTYIFLATENAVYASIDDGENWTYISYGVPYYTTQVWGGALEIKSGFLYWGTSRIGVWKTDINGINLSVHESNLNNEILIFPNPTNGVFAVELPMNNEIAHLRITDVTGKIVYRQECDFNRVDASSLKSGLYFIEVETVNREKYFKRIVII